MMTMMTMVRTMAALVMLTSDNDDTDSDDGDDELTTREVVVGKAFNQIVSLEMRRAEAGIGPKFVVKTEAVNR
jgi:hypothetical protein